VLETSNRFSFLKKIGKGIEKKRVSNLWLKKNFICSEEMEGEKKKRKRMETNLVLSQYG